MNNEIGVSLREFAKGRTQQQIAGIFGVSQGAVAQMLASSRDIRVIAQDDGSFDAVDIRPIGRRSSRKAA